MARILLSAYACEPGRGSEPGVGWSWATELARLGHQVTVITRGANRRAIAPEAPLRPDEDLTFVYYDLPLWIQHCRSCPGGKAFYYVLWQWFVVRRVRQLFPTLPFDVVHHVTYVSVRYPSFMGSLGIPFWFGPVSGGEVVPPLLRHGFSLAHKRRDRLRDLSNFLVALDPLLRRTFRQAERILVTRDTLPLVPRRWRHKTTVHLAIGLSEPDFAGANFQMKPSAHDLRVLYAGRLLEWKGVDIALRAIAQVMQSHAGIRFTIVGDGPAKGKLAELSRELGLEGVVRWVGWLPQWGLVEHYATADVLLFPSLRDSGGMVVLEALAHGLPVLCTDLGGPGIIVNRTCGRAITTAGRNPEQFTCDLAGTLLEMVTVPSLLESLSYGARVRAREFNFQGLVQSIYPSPSARPLARQA
ncbi:MAG: glycosyltransferase [Candidatus Korobacteraceae bacterium]